MIDIQLTDLVKEFEVGQKILDGFTLKVDEGEQERRRQDHDLPYYDRTGRP